MDKKVKHLSPEECERLYELINSNLQAILESIPKSGHVDEYDYLIQNSNLAADPEYQRRYRGYWQLLGIIVSPEFCRAYFTILQTNLNNITSLNQVVRQLYQIPVDVKGQRRKIHFSFSSKLIHMIDPHSPIYDSMVVKFFSFSAKAETHEEKILELSRFHQFLTTEYQRVLNLHLLTPSIKQFRQHFSPIKFTDEKIIDSLIWAFVKWREAHERNERKARPRDLSREDKKARMEQADAQHHIARSFQGTVAKERYMVYLPHGGGGKFDACELVKHIRASGCDYIIQGQQKASLVQHTKPHSLDYWLRQFAKCRDTKQAVNSVCEDLVATGLFKISDDLVCPSTGRRVKGLRLVEGQCPRT